MSVQRCLPVCLLRLRWRWFSCRVLALSRVEFEYVVELRYHRREVGSAPLERSKYAHRHDQVLLLLPLAADTLKSLFI